MHMNYTVQFDGSIDCVRSKKSWGFETKKLAMEFAKNLRKDHDNKQCIIFVVRECPEEITPINYTGYKKHG